MLGEIILTKVIVSSEIIKIAAVGGIVVTAAQALKVIDIVKEVKCKYREVLTSYQNFIELGAYMTLIGYIGYELYMLLEKVIIAFLLY